MLKPEHQSINAIGSNKAQHLAYIENRGRELSSQIAPTGEAAIWARLIESQPEDLAPDAARYLLRFRFPESDQARLQELAERSQAGTLSEEEGREFDSHYTLAICWL